ncbi:hypothetical protein AB0902_11250 [Streptomyces syringium]
MHGGPFSKDPDHAFQYGYAYQRLCSLTGSFLDNSCFCPYRGEWLSIVDQGQRAGHAPPLEPEVVEAVMQCIQWMRRAESRPGFGIIGFSS